MKPTITAAQRCQRTSSARKITDSIVTNDGRRNNRQKASAIGSFVNVMIEAIAPIAPQANLSSHKGRFVLLRISNQESPLPLMKGSAAQPKSAPTKAI